MKKESANIPKWEYWPTFSGIFLLLTELDGAACSVHTVYNCKGFQLIAKIADDASALLESFFHGNADAFYRAACLCDNGQKPLRSAAVCKKIIDDQNVIALIQEFLRYDDLVLTLMGEGFHLSHIDVAVDVDALGFLRKNNRNVEISCCNATFCCNTHLFAEISFSAVTRTFACEKNRYNEFIS